MIIGGLYLRTGMDMARYRLVALISLITMCRLEHVH